MAKNLYLENKENFIKRFLEVNEISDKDLLNV